MGSAKLQFGVEIQVVKAFTVYAEGFIVNLFLPDRIV